MKIVIEHDDDCPLGVNGLRAYDEARAAFSTPVPELVPQDRVDLAIAEHELEEKQRCTCGMVQMVKLLEEGKVHP